MAADGGMRMRRALSVLAIPFVVAFANVFGALRAVVIGGFVVLPRIFWAVEVHGLEHDHRWRSSYLAMNHKRDLDSVMPMAAVVRHRGWRAITGDVRFGMRADGFAPGFLARVVPRPRWLAWLLHPFSVGWILRQAGTYPLEGPSTRPAEMWIRDARRVYGNVRAGEILTPDYLRALAAGGGRSPEAVAALRLSRVLGWRYQDVRRRYAGPEICLPLVRRTLERRLAATVRRELADMDAWLARGGSLYGAPEGRLSPDGRIGRVSAGSHRLLRDGPAATRVVPIAIVYDFMITGRPRVFVDVAPPLAGGVALARTELDARLRAAWLSAARFTCTQLASGFLVRAAASVAPTFTLDDLAASVRDEAVRLARAGRHVDARLLDPHTARGRCARYLRFAARRGLVRHTMRGVWAPVVGDLDLAPASGEVGYDRWPLAYAWNELQDMLAAGGLRVVATTASERVANA